MHLVPVRTTMGALAPGDIFADVRVGHFGAHIESVCPGTYPGQVVARCKHSRATVAQAGVEVTVLRPSDATAAQAGA